MVPITVRRVAPGIVLGLLLLLPAEVGAQLNVGAIAGVARDATGAVVPGVTVEAASPALIEGVRVVVTDNQGRYRIIELRPGTYTVTFTIPGFSTTRREGIELTTGFTATVNADMVTGGIEETVTVTGASPLVDIQNVRTQNVLTREVLDALPNAKMTNAYAALTLGVVASGLPDVGGINGESATALAIHGGSSGDMKYQMDGMNYNYSMSRGGGASRAYFLNHVAAQEVVLETSGQGAESETGGVQINIVPKEGSNQTSGSLEGAWANESLQANNIDDALRDRGLTAAPTVRAVDDFGFGIGGPLKRDKLWYYASYRKMRADRFQVGNFFNKTLHTMFYTPDLDRQAWISFPAHDFTGRFTWAASPNHKFSFYESFQRNCSCYFGTTSNVSPEAARHTQTRPSLTQATWTYTASNRLLYEAGFTGGINNRDVTRTEEALPTDIPIRELSTGTRYGGPIQSDSSISLADLGETNPHQINGRFSVTYVTGSHSFKVGIRTYMGFISRLHTLNGNPDIPGNPALQYRFRIPTGGTVPVPNSLVQYLSPHPESERTEEIGIFIQDQWTQDRMTLNLGLRFDRMRQWVPASTRPASFFTPELSFPAVDDVPNWKDISPRLGIVYDIAGDGRTAIKASYGRYLLGDGTRTSGANNPSNTVVVAARRNWDDFTFPDGDPRNGNFIPDCDLKDNFANNECGTINNLAFGTERIVTSWADDLLRGWGVRPSNWKASVSFEHELAPGVGMRVGYYRTWWSNFRATQNTLVSAADFDPFCITQPVDSRLPGGGGSEVCGFFNITPDKFGLSQRFLQPASNFGDQSEVYNGIEAAVTARFGDGGLLSGGVSSGTLTTDNCDIVLNRPDVSATSTIMGNSSPTASTDFCHAVQPWEAVTQIKIQAAYPLPGDFQASLVFQNLPGRPADASFVARNADIAPSLGRDLAGGRSTATIADLYQTYDNLEGRMTQVDLRLTKSIPLGGGGARLRAMVDLYNVLNGNAINSVTTRYGSSWLVPRAILSPRLLKLGARIDF